MVDELEVCAFAKLGEMKVVRYPADELDSKC